MKMESPPRTSLGHHIKMEAPPRTSLGHHMKMESPPRTSLRHHMKMEAPPRTSLGHHMKMESPPRTFLGHHKAWNGQSRPPASVLSLTLPQLLPSAVTTTLHHLQPQAQPLDQMNWTRIRKKRARKRERRKRERITSQICQMRRICLR